MNITYKHDQHEPILAIVLNNQEIGTISYSVHPNNTVEIDHFWVNEGYREKGYGRLLLTKFIEMCENNQLDTIYLMTLHNYKRAVKVYRSAGFQFITSLDGCIYMKKVLKE